MSSVLTVYRTIEFFFILVAGIIFVIILYNECEKLDVIMGGVTYSGGAVILIVYILSVPSKLTKRERFKKFYGFHPKLLTQRAYQGQVIVKLLFLVEDLFKIQRGITSYQPGVRQILEDIMGDNKKTKRERNQEEYEKTLGEYMSHMELLNHYQPEFAKSIPHWTKLHSFVKSYFESNQDEPYTPETQYSIQPLLKSNN